MILIKNEIEWTKSNTPHLKKNQAFVRSTHKLVYSIMGTRAPGDKGF